MFFSFKKHIAMCCQFWLLLILKECIMQNIIINVNFAHFWLNSFSHSLLQALALIICLCSYLIDACILNKIRKFKWSFMNTSLVLKITTLLGPMLWNWYGISCLLKIYQKLRILCCYVPIFD